MIQEKEKVVIIIPTYNESENIIHLLKKIKEVQNLSPFKQYKIHVLVVDDNSPDGTAEKVKKYAQTEGKGTVHLLLRKKNRGRGYAGIAGFKYALKENAEYIIEMDADFSHDPKHIPELLSATQKFDVVLGSRFVKGGKIVGRETWRNIITFFANAYIQIMFGVSVRDCNSGYRCFKRKVLEKIIDSLKARGPDIVQEVLFYVHLNKFTIGETPIVFKERKNGNSKLTMRHLFKGYTAVLRLKLGF